MTIQNLVKLSISHIFDLSTKTENEHWIFCACLSVVPGKIFWKPLVSGWDIESALLEGRRWEVIRA